MRISPEDIINHFPSFEKELVKDIIDESMIKVISKGDYLLKKGQYFKSIILIYEGLVKVYRENGNGNEYFLFYLQGGEAFALSMIPGKRDYKCEINAIAFSKTIVINIPLSCMDVWMKEHKSWYLFVFDTFRTRIAELIKIFDSVVFRNLEEKLIFYLLRHSEKLNNKSIPLTKTEIARELNTSREVITRLLKKLSALGKVKLHKSSIEIL
jgi:CRP/FNR family transcriptional regulator